MVSDWIIVGAMLVLGAVVVLFIRSTMGVEPPRDADTPRSHTKTVPGE